MISPDRDNPGSGETSCYVTAGRSVLDVSGSEKGH